MPGIDAASTTGWSDLAREFDRWGGAGRIATLWWRDDDAVSVTPQLRDLLHLAGAAPLALAVIPAAAGEDLAAALDEALGVTVLQHGWGHADHAPAGAKKSEFPPTRPAAAVAKELAAGQVRLRALFGRRALPVLVPPWNRFPPEFVPLLMPAGIIGLSAMASSKAVALPDRIARIDAHVDFVAWKGDRGFIGDAAALCGILRCLRARRLGLTDPGAATGILTHHLVMDRASAAFLARLAALIADHPAARWAAVAELLGPP
jgi:hypothetical protein